MGCKWIKCKTFTINALMYTNHHMLFNIHRVVVEMVEFACASLQTCAIIAGLVTQKPIIGLQYNISQCVIYIYCRTQLCRKADN